MLNGKLPEILVLIKLKVWRSSTFVEAIIG